MKKIRYQFNKETLSFIKVEVNFIEHYLKPFLSRFAISIILGIALFVLATLTIESPKTENLKQEEQTALLRYKVLDDQLSQMLVRLSDIQTRDDHVYRTFFELSPLPKSIREAGIGGAERYANVKEDLEHGDLVIKCRKKIDKLNRQIYVQSKSFDEIVSKIKDKEDMLACIPAIQPISKTELTRFGSAFGMRMHPILGYMRMHEGVDLVAPRGTKVYASGNGKIIKADWLGGFGKCVKIDHGYNHKSVYGHLSQIFVKEGQTVKRGDVIGLVGSTGLSSSNHLHYEVHRNNIPVNPLNYYYNDITAEDYQKMIENSKSTHTFEQ